ncbi:hypothetical protein HJFPF1_05875 [Paramyrothecium foliicola]|nr:hypothetical protein HJFPF1_05875 [Paramyrothecium foliicola]
MQDSKINDVQEVLDDTWKTPVNNETPPIEGNRDNTIPGMSEGTRQETKICHQEPHSETNEDVNVIYAAMQSPENSDASVCHYIEASANGSHKFPAKAIDCPILESAEEATKSQLSRKSTRDIIHPSKLHSTRLQIAAVAVSLALLAVVITFVQATYIAEQRSLQGLTISSLLKIEASAILAILRLSQGVLSLLTTLAIESVFLLLQWNTMDTLEGIPYLTVLTLSPSTSAWGLISIIGSGAATASAKMWAASRRVFDTAIEQDYFAHN